MINRMNSVSGVSETNSLQPAENLSNSQGDNQLSTALSASKIKESAETMVNLVKKHDLNNIKMMINYLDKNNIADFMEKYTEITGRHFISDLHTLKFDNNSWFDKIKARCGYGELTPQISEKEINSLISLLEKKAIPGTKTANMISASSLLNTLNSRNISNIKSELEKKLTPQDAINIYCSYNQVAKAAGEIAANKSEKETMSRGGYSGVQRGATRRESLLQGVLNSPAFSKATKAEQKECFNMVIDKLVASAEANNVSKDKIQQFRQKISEKNAAPGFDEFYDGKYRYMTAWYVEEAVNEYLIP